MRRFHFAIKALNDELLRCVGKAAVRYVEKGINPNIAVNENKVRNLKKAIKILEDHPENTNV